MACLEKVVDRSYYTLMSKGELRKEHLIETGLEVMKARGYNGTSVKDIVDAAGVPKGSFYSYFSSKEAFAVDAIDRAASEAHELSAQVLGNRALAPIPRLIHFFSSQADECCDSEFKVGCFLGNICQEMADGSDAIRAKVNAKLSNQTQLVQAVIDEAKKNGDLDSEVDSYSLAEFVFNAWEGALMRMKASKSRAPLDAFLQHLSRVLHA